MNIIVSGGRNNFLSYSGYVYLDKLIINLPGDIAVYNGGATGVDRCIEGWAMVHGLVVRKYLPMWDVHGKKAGPIRNAAMVDDAGSAAILIAYAGGAGTTNIVNYAKGKIVVHDLRNRKDFIC